MLQHSLARLIFVHRSKPLRRLAAGLIVGGVVAILLAAGLRANLLVGVRTRLNDLTYSPRATTGMVVIVAVDDASLAAFGRSPGEWDRVVYADLVRRLDEAGARVITFDIAFIDPSPADEVLAEAMREAGTVVQPVLGAVHSEKRITRAGELFAYSTLARPAAPLAAAGVAFGHVNVRPDDDGFVRRLPLFVAQDDLPMPALALAAYQAYLDFPPDDVLRIERGAVRFAGRTLYTDDFGQMRITFFGPPSHVIHAAPSSADDGAPSPGLPAASDSGAAFDAYSLVDVVEGRIPPERFTDKIVLIGALDAAALPDTYPVPSASPGDKMYGVEIHANAIETIHQSHPAFRARVTGVLDLGLFRLTYFRGTTSFPLRDQPLNEQIALAAALALLSGAALPFLRWYASLALVLLAYAGVLLWAFVSFLVWSRVIELLAPALALGLTYAGTLIVLYLFEERRRSQINDLFSRYVSAEIAQKIVETFDQGALELGGEEREITVLFADVRGFTALSEGLPPAEVVGLLNLFLEEMSTIVLHYGGAINKYIGDNLMAFWNAPYPQADHAWLAAQAARDMLIAIERLNARQAFKSPVQFGVGVNTGPAIVGNIGSRRRLEYTPIGDTVNVAARLSGAAAGGSALLGARTYALAADRLGPLPHHALAVKGRSEPVDAYELRVREPELSNTQRM